MDAIIAMSRPLELLCGVLLVLAGPFIFCTGFFADFGAVPIGRMLIGLVDTVVGIALLVGRETLLRELDDDAEARG